MHLGLNAILVVMTTFVASITSVALACLHLIYTGDSVAKLVGYPISVFAVPVLIGTLMGLVAALIQGGGGFSSAKRLWWIPLVCSVFAISPSALYMFGVYYH